MKFKDRKEQRKVNETMASLLMPLKEHADEKTKEAIDITMRILIETEVMDNE